MDGWTWEPTDEGTPQGSVISPILANIVHGLDQMAEDMGVELVRYADDFVALCETREEADSALSRVSEWSASAGLTLHPDKTRIVAHVLGESFDFLGFSFGPRGPTPCDKSVQRLRNKIRERTPRNSGRSLKATVADLNPMMRGWFQYFKAGPEDVFARVDSFVRRRLRAMLDVRKGKHPSHTGATNQRWPNAFFEHAKLYSMTTSKRNLSAPSGAKH